MKPFPLAVLLALFAGACAQYELVEPGRREIGAVYSVDPGIQWSRMSGSRGEYWTVDGPRLEILHFIDGLKDGDILFNYGQIPAEQKDKLPVFRATMTEIEVEDFVVDTLIASGNGRVEATGLRPAAFGSLPGFRFELAFTSDSGVDRQGFAVGTLREDKLYLILYGGTRIHYFDQYDDVVEGIIASIETI